jgi:hypothetical protein
VLSKEETFSDHQHEARERPLIPTPWVKQEPWRRLIIVATILAGDQWWRPWKPRDANMTLQRTTRPSSSTSSDQHTRRHCFHQHSARPPKQVAEYFWMFKSSMKLRFQRIKNEVNRRFLQAGIAETLKVVHSEISGQHAAPKLKRSLLTCTNSV